MSPFDVRADPVLTPPKTGSNPSREWGVKSLEIWCATQSRANPSLEPNSLPSTIGREFLTVTKLS
jgi:hypothetical protein